MRTEPSKEWNGIAAESQAPQPMMPEPSGAAHLEGISRADAAQLNASPSGQAEKEEHPLITFALFAYNQERFIREEVEGAFS